MARQPNILLISTDQQRADHLGCYGNSVVRTPAIDGLAARGDGFRQVLRRLPGLHAQPRCHPDRTHADRERDTA